MIIRKAKNTEWSQLQKLNDEVFIDNVDYDEDIVHDWAFSKQGEKYFKELVSDPSSICFVAEKSDGNLVGYIAASHKTFSYRKSKYLEVDNMGVSLEFRSKGIGGKLMSECKKWAKEKGYQRLFVSSYYGNEKAIKFYKDNGFDFIDVSLEANI